jgi:hypothetical protein
MKRKEKVLPLSARSFWQELLIIYELILGMFILDLKIKLPAYQVGFIKKSLHLG